MKQIPLWPKGEQFFLIEILNRGIQAIQMSLNEDKLLAFGPEWRDASWTDLSGRLSPHRFVKNVIIGVDSSLAYTAIVPIRILRENPNTTLYAIELENLFAKEVGRVFSMCRSDASRILGVDDLDVVLANSRVIDIKLDGHRVLHPVGLRAAKLEAVLELSLTTRELFQSIKDFIKSRQSFYFTEIGRAELLSLAKAEPLPLHALRLRAPSSLVMGLEEEPVGYALSRREFSFSEESLLAVIREEWGISDPAARELYASYVRKEMSLSAAEFFKKILSPLTERFHAELDGLKLKGKMFLEHELPLPFDLPLRKGKLELLEPPIKDILHRAGFEQKEERWTDAVLFRKLAPFLSFYYDKSDTTLNRWLKRHLSWLGAPSRP